MNSVKKFALILFALLLGSCQDFMFNMDSDEGTVHGFTINATYGEPNSKAAFDEDGLNLNWTPGDVLYLVDPLCVNPTVTLTTDITDSVKTAKFHTDELLATGWISLAVALWLGPQGIPSPESYGIVPSLQRKDQEIF